MYPFNWDFKNPNAENYGQYFWGILLNDGRYIYVHADKAVITNTGDLMMMRMRNYKLTKAEKKARDEANEIAVSYIKYDNFSELHGFNEYSVKHQKLVDKEEELVMEPNLVMSSGNWVSYFAANVMSGEPVSLDNAYKADGTPE